MNPSTVPESTEQEAADGLYRSSVHEALAAARPVHAEALSYLGIEAPSYYRREGCRPRSRAGDTSGE